MRRTHYFSAPRVTENRGDGDVPSKPRANFPLHLLPFPACSPTEGSHSTAVPGENSRAPGMCLLRLIALCFAAALRTDGAAWAQGTASAAASLPHSSDQPRAFRIPAGDAASTLAECSDQAGITLVYALDHVRDIRAAAVVATLVPRAALEHMIAGTPLLVLADARTGTLMLKLRPQPSPAKAPVRPSSSSPDSMIMLTGTFDL